MSQPKLICPCLLDTLELAADLCGSLYAASPSLAAAASSAIVRGTSSALSAIATIDPLKLGQYPACGVCRALVFL